MTIVVAPALSPVDHDPFSDGELTAAVPATAAQREVWVAAQITEEASLAYNEGITLRCRGVLDVDAMKGAIDDLPQRHEALRASFSRDGQSLCIARIAVTPIQVIDLTQLPDPHQREERFAKLLVKEGTTPFDLEHGPLFRASIVRLAADEHRVVIGAHHLVCDGWSFGVLLGDLGALYTARCARVSPELAPAHGFSTFAREEVTRDTSGEERYWIERFAQMPEPLQLPTDFVRPPMRRIASDLVSVELEPQHVAELKKAGGRLGASFFVTLFTAFHVFVARVSGQHDLVIGVPAAAQSAVGRDSLVGHCANLLPIRMNVDLARPFSEVVKEARKLILDAYDHQRFSVGEILRHLPIPRDPSRLPLTTIDFNLDSGMEGSGLVFEGLDVTVHNNTRVAETFELFLNAFESKGRVVFDCQYATSLWRRDTIHAWLRGYSALLRAIAKKPETPCADLPIVEEADRQQALVEWNQTAAEYPREATIPSLVNAQALRRPDSVAVSFEGKEITYRELETRSNRLARVLAARGAGPGVPVGVAVERSECLPVALLAILKTGAAYLPLDPSYPRDRLAFMATHAGLKVLVTEHRFSGLVPIGAEGTVRLDTDSAEIERASEAPIDSSSQAQIAYILYTSGSTGKPKGVEVPHRAVVNLLGSMAKRPGFSWSDRVLAITSLSFDIAGLELWLPLIVGSQVEIVSRDIATDGMALARRLDAGNVTVIQGTPSTFRMLVEAGWAGNKAQKVNVGGEALPPELSRELLDRVGSVWNCYGPTETTIYSCVHRVERDQPVLIGRPIDNTRVYVLDKGLSPVPVGVPGELYIAGDGLARGYLGRADLTQERFVADPFFGDRMYKTGDLCRHLPTGDLEYLGRIDFQVKLRGHRIELGEVEAALAEHPLVREAVVVVRTEGGDAQLVAYVTTTGQATEAPQGLRVHLSTKLPGYMAPTTYVALARLPVTANNKIDRQALAARSGVVVRPAEAPVAPRTPTEEAIAGLFASVLRVDRVGIEDDFFALGGHSLLGTQVTYRLRATLGVELPLRVLFEAPTVARLAQRVDTMLARTLRVASSGAPPLARRPRKGAPLLSFAQQRLWLLDQLEPESPAYNIPQAVRLHGPIDAEALELAFRAIVQRHEVLRTTFAKVDGEPRQIIASEVSFSLGQIQASGESEGERQASVAKTVKAVMDRPFDLRRGPILRATLIRLSDTEHVLVTVVHHIASDGWSLGILWRELSAIYAAVRESGPSPLQELPIQYADYAEWQREWLSGERLREQLDYWKDQLRDVPDGIELPTIGPRPPIQTYLGAVHRVTLDAELSAQLKELARREGATLYMTLLAAFQALLARASGQDDIVVGSPIAGRTRDETAGLIGFFLNTLVLRTSLGGDPPFRELLTRVRETTLEAYAHQDVPFEKLIEELAPPRNLSKPPFFQVFFNMLNMDMAWKDLPGVSATPWEAPDEVAKFDLNLYAEEHDGRIALSLVFNTALFDATQTQAMLDHLCEILRAVPLDPSLCLSALPMSLPAVCALPLNRIKGHGGVLFEPFLEEATGVSIGERFNEQVSRHRDRPAIRTEEGDISYGELGARVCRIATAIGPEAGRVVLLFEAGPAVIAAIFGTLAAGAIYVPLDLASPPKRLSAMLEDAAATTILTHTPCLTRAAALAREGCRILNVDTVEAPLLPEAGLPQRPASPDSIAYVLFTSGSTGRPKGVVQTHANVLCHIRNYTNRLFIDRTDVIALVASYASDAGVMDIFGALLNGAALCPIDPLKHGLRRLPERFREHGVTFYHGTPTVFRHLVASLGPTEILSGVRRVVLGGEEARPSDVEAFTRHFGADCVLVNGLGPTESTLALQYHIDRNTPLPRRSVPVGFPVDGVQVSLMNGCGEQLAVYGTGEIVLRSPQIALGYWQGGEEDVASFPLDPERAGVRIYRTGDLARRLPGGALEYLGRIDHQVKIHGYRIELGEIECVLVRHPGVQQAVVIPQKDGDLQKRLVAYVVGSGSQAPPLPGLREHVQNALPLHMVPASFVIVDSLPMLPNGKVNRRALSSAEMTAHAHPAQLAREIVQPRDEVEAALIGIFRDLLRAKEFGIRDSFFALGGHSMLAVRLVEEIEKRFGKTLPLLALFEAQTVEQLATRICTDSKARHDFTLVPIRKEGHKRPLFLISRPNVNSLGYLALARHLDHERPVYGLQFDYPEESKLGRPYSEEEFLTWATSYVATIRRIQPQGPYLLGGMCEGALIAFTMTRLLEGAGQEVGLLAMFDTWPVENTRDPRMDWLLHSERTLRNLLDLSPAQHLSRLVRAVRRIFMGSGEPSPDVRKAPSDTATSWTARNYPGHAFVPPMVSATITVFRVKRQPYWRIQDAHLGWSDRTTGGVDVCEVPGKHRTVLRERHVPSLARELDERLSRLDVRHGAREADRNPQ